MRFRVTSSTLLAFLLSVSSISQADIQLDAGFASEYVRDGIKQSKAKPVIQLDGIYTSQLGFYGGAWLSGVERGSPDSTRFELDGFAGWYIPFTSFLAVDLGYTRATFLGDAQATKQAYGEGFFNLLLNDATTFGYRLADDYMGSGESLQTLELAHTVNSGEFGFEFSTRQYRYLNTTEDVNWG
ncbi:MAG: TorF family putative porin, partial [Oleispira antarctica]|nr:TorF family putative porin [Oleispira antarctica]MBQ0792737.1 TorF family putative porin [Oleispira antarctica]